jgi:hypothetical protein
MMATSLNLPPSVISPQDIARLELELLGYADWFRHNAIKQEMHIQQGTAMPGLSPESIVLLRSAATDGRLSQSSLDALLMSIKQYRNTAPTMTITLAAPAGNQLRQSLTEWCRRELNPGLLVEFRFNATILGGMVVRYGSRVFDWSFRRAILNKRQGFAEVLRRV